MLSRSLLLSCAVAFYTIHGVTASPACSRGSTDTDSCIASCRSKFGWPGFAMGTDAWGAVAKAYSGDADSMTKNACGESTGVSGGVSVSDGAATSPNATEPVIAAPSPQSEVTSSTSSFTSTTRAVSSSSSVPTSSSASTHVQSSIHASSLTAKSSSSNIATQAFIKSSPSAEPTFSSTKPPPSSSPAPAPSPPPPPPPPPSPSPTPKPSSKPSPVSSSEEPKSTEATVATSNNAKNSNVESNSGATSSSDINLYLAAHNSVRAQHGASDLTWSDSLAATAQTWADKCVFKHSGGTLGPFGENLAAGTGSSYGITEAVKSWTDEVSEYSPSNPQPSHFTQVVWKSSTQVGCAVQSCNGIFDPSFGQAKFFVCEYSPAGNVIGEFDQNVQV